MRSFLSILIVITSTGEKAKERKDGHMLSILIVITPLTEDQGYSSTSSSFNSYCYYLNQYKPLKPWSYYPFNSYCYYSRKLHALGLVRAARLSILIVITPVILAMILPTTLLLYFQFLLLLLIVLDNHTRLYAMRFFQFLLLLL